MDQNLSTLLQAIVLSIPVFYMLRVNYKKTEAEAKEKQKTSAKLEDEITERVLARAQGEMLRLEERLTEVEDEFNSLLHGAWTLHQQLLDNHIEPKYAPPRRIKDNQPKK
jgi:hypothetical protein